MVMSHQEMLCQTRWETGGVVNHDVNIIEWSALRVNSMSQEMPLDSQPSGHKKGFTHLPDKFCQSMKTSGTLILSSEYFRQERFIEHIKSAIRHSSATPLRLSAKIAIGPAVTILSQAFRHGRGD
jgi:hypothetical protein